MKLTNILPAIMGLDSISPQVLNQQINNESVTVFDVNSPQSWATNHVPGAQNLDPIQFEESDLPTDKSSIIVFYCSNPMCRKAPNAAKKAKGMGFEKVKVMPAGISGWVSSGLPVEEGRS